MLSWAASVVLGCVLLAICAQFLATNRQSLSTTVLRGSWSVLREPQLQRQSQRKAAAATMAASPATAAIIPAVTRLSSRIIRILGCNPSPMTLQGTNTYLIGTGRDRILLDTGDADHPAYIQHLTTVLRTENARISAILLTHWHHDHIGGCGDVLRSVDGGLRDLPVWKFPRSDAPDHYPLEIPASVELRRLQHDQLFRVEGATVRVLHTPGHTTDHVCVHLDEERALFSGDCILGEGSAVFEDLYEYMRSLREIAARQPARIYPAHGNVIESPVEKVRWYIEHRERREEQLFRALAVPAVDGGRRAWTRMQLVEEVYGAEVPRELWPAAAVNVQHHLRKMCREGRLEELAETTGAEAEERQWRVAEGAAAKGEEKSGGGVGGGAAAAAATPHL